MVDGVPNDMVIEVVLDSGEESNKPEVPLKLLLLLVMSGVATLLTAVTG